MSVKAIFCDKDSQVFSYVIAGTCVEEEGKGRGFLPSLEVTREGRSRRHEQRKRDGGEKRQKKRDKRERRGKSENEGALKWGRRKCGKEKGRNRGRKYEEYKAKRGVGGEWREGRRWALAAVLTLGSFLPHLLPVKAGEAQVQLNS